MFSMVYLISLNPIKSSSAHAYQECEGELLSPTCLDSSHETDLVLSVASCKERGGAVQNWEIKSFKKLNERGAWGHILRLDRSSRN